MSHSAELEDQVSSWPNVSAQPHRFGGREFRFGNAELGHIHFGGILDIPFPRSVHDALLADGLASEHHWVPNSGWITFRIRNQRDFDHALWLLRLSYLRYALKTAADPRALLDRECESLHLSPHYCALLEPFLPRTTNKIPAEHPAASLQSNA